MKTSKLDYSLPSELIATNPVSPRDSAKLLVVNKKRRRIVESNFSEIGNFLLPGDLLVFNKSKVFAARIYATKTSGKKVEVFFLSEAQRGIWEVLVGGHVKDGEELNFGHGLTGVANKGFPITLSVNRNKKQIFDLLNRYGEVPLPPYIKRKATKKDKTEYQNVFARETGSAAAPTAGLHFTNKLIKALNNQGVETGYVTLHVGLGTFAPIKSKKVEEHEIHEESYTIDNATKSRILQAKSEGRRVIACGTTSLRVLESMSTTPGLESGKTKIYIYPGYKFKIVDGLITNFHTPKSSLLALVWAFGGQRLMRRAYALAIKNKYRFYSYGDGMFIS